MTRRGLAWGAAGLVGTLGAASGLYLGLVTGRVTIDLGIGRRTRDLGPLEVVVAAPRATVYQVLTAPYAERRPRVMAAKVEIIERGAGAVLAAHHTELGKRLTATTVEMVSFDPPSAIAFRLVRGPVPLVTETFTLTEHAGGTTLAYEGVLGTDLGRAGEAWGALVARSWISAVRASMESAKAESERLAATVAHATPPEGPRP